MKNSKFTVHRKREQNRVDRFHENNSVGNVSLDHRCMLLLVYK